jgi:hypothetical protein
MSQNCFGTIFPLWEQLSSRDSSAAGESRLESRSHKKK